MPQPSRQAPSQAPQTSPKAAQPAAPSPSQPQADRAPPRQVSQQDRGQDRAPPRPAAASRQAEATSAEPRVNPYAAQARSERRAAAIAGLREQRGQAAPREAAAGSETPAEGQTVTRPGTSPDHNSQSTPQSNDSEAQAALATLRAQQQEREAKLQAAEAKVRDAHTLAEKRAAEAEAREAKTEAHLKRLEMLRGDPAQFLAEAGISEEEFKRYLATGGKPTGEQQRLSETEKQLASMRDELAKARAEAKAEVAAIRREREDAEFSRQLSSDDYTLVNTMGGLPAVRAKQVALRETLGKDVTLAEAAGQLEHEWNHGFKELLKNQAVRAKLGLDVAAPATPTTSTPEPSKAAPPRTLTGSLSSTTSHKSESLAWNDWRGKKERVLREMARARGN